MITAQEPNSRQTQARVALLLRVGLGLVFISGGLAKLMKLLNPERAQGMVETYLSAGGYINQFFQDYLFSGGMPDFVTPWSFLTLLSTFELISGILLVVGLLVRPLALVWGLMFWTFVVSLPVTTSPGAELAAPTHLSPALLVMIRDLALSAVSFVLFNLGAGRTSLDADVFSLPAGLGRNWDPLGLLLRLSLGAVFLIGGLFHGMDHIATLGLPAWLLLPVGLLLISGIGVHYAAIAAGALLLFYMVTKLPDASGVVGYMNFVKREFALLAASAGLAITGGGSLFTLTNAWKSLQNTLQIYTKRAGSSTQKKASDG